MKIPLLTDDSQCTIWLEVGEVYIKDQCYIA